ncbi:MAG TPA: hypothetical protein VMS93_08015 [Candidatus Saccharimonadales bacterium]|nr:hypothetical protein [Candidatus Saccharimonadales bacterium]
MDLTIGVAGLGDGAPTDAARMAYEVGRAVAERGALLVAGKGARLARAAVEGARSRSGRIIGVVPGLADAESRDPGTPAFHDFDCVVRFSDARTARGMCDLLVGIYDYWSYPGVVPVGYAEGHTVGVLLAGPTTAAGVARVSGMARRYSRPQVLYDVDPDQLVDRLIHQLLSRPRRREDAAPMAG